MWALHYWRFALFVTAAISTAAVVLFYPDWINTTFGWVDRDRINDMVTRAGIWGPLLIIALMISAVVFSPIPSAPIALAAGAAYGHTQGTVLVVVGAETGALIAFGLARVLGRETMRRWFGDKLSHMRYLGEQNVLMWIIFASRLMPFVSFDLVSYAVGLSNLKFWRFSLATFAGIVPASFLLAHFGGEMADGRMRSAVWLALGLGLITGLPVLWAILRSNRSRLN